MKTLYFVWIILSLIMASYIYGAEDMYKNFKRLLNMVQSKKATENDIQKFVDTLKTTKTVPITYKNKAIFIYYDKKAKEVDVRGDATGWSKGIKMRKLSDSGLFYTEQTYPKDARLDYKLVVDGNWILDPLNHFTSMGGFDKNSELRMPEFKFNWWVVETPTRKGTIKEIKIKSKLLSETRKIKVYLPPDYSYKKEYPIVYLQDGGDYLKIGKANKIFDNLISKRKIPPVIGVFVYPKDRNIEYTLNENYVSFFVKELVPFIESRWRTKKDYKIIVGDSLGALISTFIAFRYPDIFKKVIAQSPAIDFYYNRKMSFLGYNIDQKIFFADKINKTARRNFSIYFCFGTFELGDKTGKKANFRKLINLFTSKGYKIKYSFYNQGHSWGMWKDDLGTALIYFLGEKR